MPPSPPTQPPTQKSDPPVKAPPTEAELRAKFKTNGDRILKRLRGTTNAVQRLMHNPKGSNAQTTFFRNQIKTYAEGLIRSSEGQAPAEASIPDQ